MIAECSEKLSEMKTCDQRRPKLTIREIDRRNDLCKRMNDLCKRMNDLCKHIKWDVTT